jgi:hypothetical protein
MHPTHDMLIRHPWSAIVAMTRGKLHAAEKGKLAFIGGLNHGEEGVFEYWIMA